MASLYDSDALDSPLHLPYFALTHILVATAYSKKRYALE